MTRRIATATIGCSLVVLALGCGGAPRPGAVAPAPAPEPMMVSVDVDGAEVALTVEFSETRTSGPRRVALGATAQEVATVLSTFSGSTSGDVLVRPGPTLPPAFRVILRDALRALGLPRVREADANSAP